MTAENPIAATMEDIQQFTQAYNSLRTEVSKVIVGQREVIDQLLVALFSGGHCLLVGVPGLAKTLLISTVADALDLEFSRIQFTPDLMPSDKYSKRRPAPESARSDSSRAPSSETLSSQTR